MLSCSLLCIAVNVFVLISGYFGIRLSVKSLLKIYLLCLFYNLLAFVVSMPEDGFSVKALICCFFVSKTHNWFFPAYFWLMFLAPICNCCLKSTDLARLRVLIILLFVLNVFSGFVVGNEANRGGYNVVHLLFIYMLGGYLYREDARIMGRYCVLSYVALAVVNAVACFGYVAFTHKNGFVAYNYNNPMVVCQAVAVFLLFKGLRIRSKFINNVAKTVVAVLLIHEVVMPELVYGHLGRCYQEGFGVFLIAALGWFLFLFVAAYAVEVIRQPIAGGVTKLILSFLPKKYAEMKL